MTDGQTKSLIKPGQKVSIVLKKDQKTGKLTEGIVKNLLTKSPSHPQMHGMFFSFFASGSFSLIQIQMLFPNDAVLVVHSG